MKASLTMGLAALAAANGLNLPTTITDNSGGSETIVLNKRQDVAAAVQEEARLVISLGSGDASTTLQVPLGTTLVTNFINRNSVETAVRERGIFCGGFQDSGASILVGQIFDGTHPASYSDTSDGGPGSRRDDATLIGSYWCSRNKMAVEERAKQVVQPEPIGGGGRRGGGRGDQDRDQNRGDGRGDRDRDRDFNRGDRGRGDRDRGDRDRGGDRNRGGNGGDRGEPSVELQVEKQRDQFVDVVIPINRLMTSDELRELGHNVIVVDIVRAVNVDENIVSCQVYSDKEGRQPLGPVATKAEAAMVSQSRTRPAPFGSIRCADRPLGGGRGGGNNGGGRNEVNNNGGNNGGGAEVQGEVHIQIEREDNAFRGTEVPVNRLVTIDENRFLGGEAIRIDVVGGISGKINNDNIRCQAWVDKEGREPIGRVATVGMAAELSADRSLAQFQAITCNA